MAIFILLSCNGHLYIYLYLIYLAIAIFVFIFILFILQWPFLSLSLSYFCCNGHLYLYLILSLAAGLPLVLSIVWVSAMALKGTDQERYCFLSHHLPRIFLPPLREILKRKTCLKYLFDLKILSVWFQLPSIAQTGRVITFLFLCRNIFTNAFFLFP